MPDRKRKPDRPTPPKEKLCKTCRRPIPFAPQKARDWDVIKFCSDARSSYYPDKQDTALEAAILSLLAERGPGKTICPSEAAKLVGGTKSLQSWQSLMQPARAAARRLVAAKKIVISQHGDIVDPATAKGAIRLKLR